MTDCRPVAWLLCCVFVALARAAGATGTYQEPADFLAEVFDGQAPAPALLWLDADLRERATAALGHAPSMLRVRYWRAGERIAWVLEEIGREEPITVGIVTAGGLIEQLRVLVFRESRGWEVRHPFFTDQFRGLGLGADGALARPVDGIAGATLSVSALTRLARLALLFDTAARQGGGGAP